MYRKIPNQTTECNDSAAWYVDKNGGRFADIYDGDIENIPEEYRITPPIIPIRTAAPQQPER